MILKSGFLKVMREIGILKIYRTGFFVFLIYVLLIIYGKNMLIKGTECALFLAVMFP